MTADNANSLSVTRLVEGVLAGDRSVLARAVTLVESNALPHQEKAQQVLQAILPHTGKSIRIGITGMPGAGKSTFIEKLGCSLTERSHKIAVLAVDPSSSVTGGSILGDKTRMQKLAVDPNAFIRPSPSGGALGGVARKTRETVLLFEAAGYDVVFVETIGVGQNEITVRSMVDFFLLLLIPGAGDDLQGIKRGVMEMADLVVINKADGKTKEAAERAREDIEQALPLLQPITENWKPTVTTVSALTGDGIEDVWSTVGRFEVSVRKSGIFQKRRQDQNKDWLHSMISEKLLGAFFHDSRVKEQLPTIEKEVASGSLPVTQAVWKLLQLIDS
jgi:LAO/AO transport system kinase